MTKLGALPYQVSIGFVCCAFYFSIQFKSYPLKWFTDSELDQDFGKLCEDVQASRLRRRSDHSASKDTYSGIFSISHLCLYFCQGLVVRFSFSLSSSSSHNYLGYGSVSLLISIINVD